MSTDKWMEKDVVHICNRIFLSHIKEQNNAIYSNMYGPRCCHTEWRKRKTNIICYCLYSNIYLQDLIELTPKKDVPFIIGDWNAKVGNQEVTGVTGKFGLGVQNGAGQRLTELCQENALVIANTLFQQNKRCIYMWTSSESQYWNQIDYILCSLTWRSSIQSAKTRPGVDWGSDHELLIAKYRPELKKVGKTTRPLRYDLNQIPYTVEVTNRFKRLDLIDSAWRTMDRGSKQWIGGSDQNISKKKKCNKGKMVGSGGLTNSWEKKSERQRREGKIHPSEWRVPENSKER